jgi:curved DNA-binding protein CbpA
MHAFSAEINDAYVTLSDPRKRLAYLCQLNGVGYNEKVIVPSYITQKQMEWLESFDNDGLTGLNISLQEVQHLTNEYESKIQEKMKLQTSLNCDEWKEVSEMGQILYVLDKSLYHLQKVQDVYTK